jgi:acetyl esterase/lipase
MTTSAESPGDEPGVVVLDPEIAASLARAPAQLRLSADTLHESRRSREALFARLPRSEAVARTDHVVRDDPRLVVRVHRPIGVDGPLPCAYSMHGGGYVIGSYAMDDVKFDLLTPSVPCVGVSVDYRLAPETPYPGALEDCYEGLRWTFEHAAELGIDETRIGVVGTSAGGGLAAALALLSRDRAEVDLAFQLLECPMLDDRQLTPSSRLDGLPIWTREENALGWRCYLGDLYGTDVEPYAAPARSVELSRLPATLVIVGSADGFRDESIDYASRLIQAGVPTDLHVLSGVPHGIQAFARSDARRRWNELVVTWLGRQVRSDH